MPAWPRWGIDAALVLAAVTALAMLTQRAAPEGIEIERREAPDGLDEVRVEVTGAVARPGVVTVAPGSRVGDAIALAGGVTTEADTAALNLARRVTDEERLLVPRIGERRTALLDLNRATAPQLEALPGIGRATAEAILAARERQPFASTDELLARGLTSARVYEQVCDLLTTR